MQPCEKSFFMQKRTHHFYNHEMNEETTAEQSFFSFTWDFKRGYIVFALTIYNTLHGNASLFFYKLTKIFDYLG